MSDVGHRGYRMFCPRAGKTCDILWVIPNDPPARFLSARPPGHPSNDFIMVVNKIAENVFGTIGPQHISVGP
jgi:hypothetical protein